jgi:hypothetical protein
MTRVAVWGLVACGVIALVAPFPWLRLAAIGAAIVLIAGAELRVEVPRRLAFVGQVSVVVLALGVAAVAVDPEHRASRLAILGAGAIVVALAGSRRVGFAFAPAGSAWPVAGVVALVVVLLCAPLDGPITWPNDELMHFLRLRLGAELLARPAALAGAAIGAVIGAAATLREGRRAAVAGGVVAAAAGAVLGGGLALDTSTVDGPALGYYPTLAVWPQALLGTNLAPSARLAFAEGWSRLLPAASLVVAAAALARGGWAAGPVRFLAAAVVATVPAMLHFGSLLYIELPFVLLALAALVAAPADRGPLPDAIVWLALVLLPLAKETMLPLVVVLVGHRFVLALREPGDARARWLGASRAAVMGAVPLAFAVMMKTPVSKVSHPYSPAPSHLVDPLYWATTARALAEQQPALLALALPGPVLAWRRGRAEAALLALASLAASLGFLALDEQRYWGYARFELLLFPGLAALALETVRALPARASAPLLAVALAANLVIVPFAPDGSRRAWFGARLYPYTDLAYPWSDALERCARLGPDAEVEVVGVSFGYRFDHYARKLGTRQVVRPRPWPQAAIERAFDRARDRPWFRDPAPREDPELTAALVAELDAAARDGPRAVVVQLPPADATAWPPHRAGYALAADLRLGACRLLVYERE